MILVYFEHHSVLYTKYLYMYVIFIYILNASFLVSWLDPLIWRGYRRELKQEDLYVIPKEVESKSLLKRFNRLVVCLCWGVKVSKQIIPYMLRVCLMFHWWQLGNGLCDFIFEIYLYPSYEMYPDKGKFEMEIQFHRQWNLWNLHLL